MNNNKEKVQRVYTLALEIIQGHPDAPQWAVEHKLAQYANVSLSCARGWIGRARRGEGPKPRGGKRINAGWTKEQRARRKEEDENQSIREWLSEEVIYENRGNNDH